MTQPDPDPLRPPEPFGDWRDVLMTDQSVDRLSRLRSQPRHRRGCSVWPFLVGVAVVALLFATPRGGTQRIGSALLAAELHPGAPQVRAEALGSARPGAAREVPVRLRAAAGGVSQTTTGLASWFDAKGYQGAVPWWKPGQDAVWATVTRFAAGHTYSTTVLVTGFCQCLQGHPGARAIDLSRLAFSELAPLSMGLIRVTVDVPVQGPRLPATDLAKR